MRSRYKITEQTPVYFITTSTRLWIPILLNETVFQILLNSFKYCQANKGFNLHGYVIMPNHLHAIISHDDPEQIPNVVVRDYKRHTATEIKTYLGNLGQFSRLFWVKIFHNKERGQNRV
ncbi:MAG: transposase [Anaerolineae bacterium]|nr:transposase [Anaerolineae bacterium]